MYVRCYRDRRKVYLSPVKICQINDHTCIGCCVNLYENTDTLKDFVKINTESFNSYFPDINEITPAFLKEYLLELEKINQRDDNFLNYNCYFAGYLDEEYKKIGCLIHPLKIGGIELRDLMPVNCIPYEKCHRDLLWDKLSLKYKKIFLSKVENNDWIEYSKNIYEFIPQLYVSMFYPEILENKYCKILIKDHGIPSGAKLQKNFKLLMEFHHLNKSEETFDRKKLYKYGELYLEDRLNKIASNKNLHPDIIKIPDNLICDGDERINGEHIYTIFLPASTITEKTIIIGTSYDNTMEKFSSNDMETVWNISFSVRSIEKMIEVPERKINYLWVFFGAEKDDIYPLRGSAYFTDLLLKGLKREHYNIEIKDIILYLEVDTIGNNFSPVEYHIPITKTELTSLEEYIKETIYKKTDLPVEELLTMKTIEHYFIETIKPEDFSDLIDKNIISMNVKDRLKELVYLYNDKIYVVIEEILNDIFGLKEIEKEKLLEEIYKLIIKKVYKPLKEISLPDIIEKLTEHNLLIKTSRGLLRNLIFTDPGHTKNFCHILIKNGFNKDNKTYGVKKSFYHFALRGVPCVSITSRKNDQKIDNEEFIKRLTLSVYEFFRSFD